MSKPTIQILVDNPHSWTLPFCESWERELRSQNYQVELIQHQNAIVKGDILLLIGCEKILGKESRSFRRYNLVVHESPLPLGRGWSPLTWQVLEGERRIAVTLFEAVDDVDAGCIYAQTHIDLDGSELVAELRGAQINATKKVFYDFLEAYPNTQGRPQMGKPTYYRKRLPEDSRLDLTKSIREQFNLMRVADNVRYPLFFDYKGCRYLLKIEKQK